MIPSPLTAVKTKDGRIYIFYKSFFREVSKDLNGFVGPPNYIQNSWGKIISKVDLAVTADGEFNQVKGKTYIVSGDFVFEYENQKPTQRNKKVKKWLGSPAEKVIGSALIQHNDELALFIKHQPNNRYEYRFVRLTTLDRLDGPSGELTSAFQTNFVYVVKFDKGFLLHQRIFKIKTVVPLDNGTYLAFYNSEAPEKVKGQMCLVTDFEEGVCILQFKFTF